MDAGVLGAILGLGLMVVGVACMQLYEYWKRKRHSVKQRKKSVELIKTTPLLVVRKHSQMKMILPK
jgi:hypothetical protein